MGYSGCNVCKHCLNGDNNYCQRGGLRSTIGIHRNGGFAKYCIAPLEQVNKLPNEVTFEQGTLVNSSFAIIRFTTINFTT